MRQRVRTDVPSIDGRRPPFDRVTIRFHWATVLLVLALFASAWLHALAGARQSDLTPALLQIHRSFGVTVWVITALRVAWRLTNATMPPFSRTRTRLQRAIIKLSEHGLYALLLAQPVTGLLTTILAGRGFALFLWGLPPLAARHEALQVGFRLSHELGALALAILTLGHAGAALIHHFVVRDDVLECMAPALGRHAPELSTNPQPNLAET